MVRPSAFLRYYLEGRVRRVVLFLHSYELFGLLGLLAWRLDVPLLWGYLLGALMHLALDVVFNGELTPRSISAFYSFAYRWAHGFDAETLIGPRETFTTPGSFWTAFFAGPVRAPSATASTTATAHRTSAATSARSCASSPTAACRPTIPS